MRASATSGVERSAKIVSTVRLYDYPASCNCYKVRLLLAQLGLQYERVPIDIFAGETLTDEYAAINPSRTTSRPWAASASGCSSAACNRPIPRPFGAGRAPERC